MKLLKTIFIYLLFVKATHIGKLNSELIRWEKNNGDNCDLEESDELKDENESCGFIPMNNYCETIQKKLG